MTSGRDRKSQGVEGFRLGSFGVRFATAIALACVGVTLPGAIAGGAAVTTTYSFPAVADAYVNSADQDANYGDESVLRIDSANSNSNSRIVNGYLRFHVEGLSDPVVSAVVRLHAANGDKDGFEVHTTGSWEEGSITWANAPAPSEDVVASSGGVDAGTWVTLDVTPLVRDNGDVSLALTTSSMSPITLDSREAGASLAPELVVTTAAVPPSNQTPPTISGTAQEGQTLTVNPGAWTGTAPISYSYQWLRCDQGGNNCASISGADATSYELSASDVGSTIEAAVTASNSASSSTATSAPTAVVVVAAPDTQAPTAPGNLSVSAATQATIAIGWSAASDNIGVAGYDLFLNGTNVAKTTGTSYTFSGLSCATSYTLAVDAFDAAGNHSAKSSVSAATGACSDTQAPTAPGNLSVSAATQATIAIGWSAASDNIGVAGYDLFLNGTNVAKTTGTSYTFSGLSCATSYTLAVDAFDAAGNHSAKSSLTSATSTCSPTSGPCGSVTTPPATFQHVVWIVMENKTYTEIIGSPNAPYINSVASKCGLATNFFAETHPSLPNYIAMTSGSPQGITDDSDPSSHPLAVPSIFSQLGLGGWRSLEESMPSNCLLSNSGLYAVRHNPAAYYTTIAAQCALQDVPLNDPPDLSAAFTFITPNLCNDMHSCPTASDVATEVKNGDQWLSTWLPKIFASSEYQSGSTVVFLTWDEDDFSADQHIATLVMSPSTPAGTTSGTRFDHYSLLRTTEELLGIGNYLGNAASATSMRSAFNLQGSPAP
jgi:chitodextrinase